MKKKYIKKLSIFFLLTRTWKFLSKRRKTQLKGLFLLIIINSFTELLSLVSIVPFLSLITNPASIYEISFMREISNFFNIYSANQLLLPTTIFFLISTLISGTSRLIFTFLTLRISSNIVSELSSEAFRKSLYKPYSYHLKTNSNILITTLTKDINEIIYLVFIPIIKFISATIISFIIILCLLYVDLNISLLSLLVVFLLYGIFFKNSAFTISKISKNNIAFGQLLTKFVQESLGAIREVIISNNYEFFIKRFSKDDLYYRREISLGTFIVSLPRLVIEPLGIMCMILLAYALIIFDKTNEVIPLIGTFSFGALKLLPYGQQIYEGINNPRIAEERLKNLLNILEEDDSSEIKKESSVNINFKEKIRLVNLTFRYEKNNSPIFEGFNLTINKGDRIGIIGKTGSGKSTFLDILLGLQTPTKGSFYIDNYILCKNGTSNNMLIKSWQKYLANVPQNIYLSDTSIAENIAFGINPKDIDYKKINEVAEKSILMEFINQTKFGFNTIVGEHGMMISGGQKQRIGIARALYKESKFLILDEATSAIDNFTEELILKNLSQLDPEITMIIVAHRLNTLKFCNKIYEIDKGQLLKRNL